LGQQSGEDNFAAFFVTKFDCETGPSACDKTSLSLLKIRSEFDAIFSDFIPHFNDLWIAFVHQRATHSQLYPIG
jgi:hypothetical protein